jgi:hypothetical protein
MLEESTNNKFESFRTADLPKYTPLQDHPFKGTVQDDGRIAFSPGVVRGSLSFGTPAFIPTLYGQQMRNPVTGQLTSTPKETGRYYLETTGFWITLAAMAPRNLRAFVPTAGDIKHETDVAFGNPAKKLVQIGTLRADGAFDNILRSDLTLGDVSDIPHDGPPGVGPGDPSTWGEWPDGSNSVPQYGNGTEGEADPYADGVFDYG